MQVEEQFVLWDNDNDKREDAIRHGGVTPETGKVQSLLVETCCYTCDTVTLVTLLRL